MTTIWLRGAIGVRPWSALDIRFSYSSVMRPPAVLWGRIVRGLSDAAPSRSAGMVAPLKWFSTRCPSVQSPRSTARLIHTRPQLQLQLGANAGEQEARTEKHDTPSAEGATATRAPQGQLSIVFTDIVKSTAIWETHASAMIDAMHTHDHMVRELILANQGYEVKQNGDGFMVAFQTATSAVQFCLDVQERLLDEHWPASILKSTSGKEVTDEHGHVLFRGLKLRMSAHWGTPVQNWNEVIQRMDYLGPAVNRAARFIEVTEGGQVVVSEEFLLQLQCELESTKGDETDDGGPGNRKPRGPGDLDIQSLRSGRNQEKLTQQTFQLRPLGDRRFKGLSEPQTLYFIVPTSLEGRVEHWHSVAHVSGVKGNLRRPPD